jgi:hypothetical protein
LKVFVFHSNNATGAYQDKSEPSIWRGGGYYQVTCINNVKPTPKTFLDDSGWVVWNWKWQ